MISANEEAKFWIAEDKRMRDEQANAIWVARREVRSVVPGLVGKEWTDEVREVVGYMFEESLSASDLGWISVDGTP